MAAAENHLIELLPRAERRRLLALCEPVDLQLSDVLRERYAYPQCVFPHRRGDLFGDANRWQAGTRSRHGRPRGMVGANSSLGVTRTPLHAVVQGPGNARRIGASAFRRELARNQGLQKYLNRYLYVLMSQLAVSAACLRFHLIGPRLARWLLMTQDRAHADAFHVTHQSLAYMLGVRRVGITTAAGALQRAGLIEYRRGELIVLNRKGLEAAACGCYAADQKSYRTWLP